ncbi:N-ethylammeline chlorohydrolase [Streptococcus pneumoniae]|nr:N-ethylammeline chlorohydrolase [Streptococcus pneumoniae]
MKIKEQTRKLVVGCSKHCFEVADRADVVEYKMMGKAGQLVFFDVYRLVRQVS